VIPCFVCNVQIRGSMRPANSAVPWACGQKRNPVNLRQIQMVLQVGHMVVDVEYNYLHGTRDQGRRLQTTQITINNRKLAHPMAVVSHVSNVNHWLLSHDNIWPALAFDHPALRARSKLSTRPSINGSRDATPEAPLSMEGSMVCLGAGTS
jgi:hypothetical protein